MPTGANNVFAWFGRLCSTLFFIMEPDVLFTVALLLVPLHSAWDVEPSVGLEVDVSSPKVELIVTVFVVSEVEILGDIHPMEELTVTIVVDPETGFEILAIEYFFMYLLKTSSPSGVMCFTSLE